MKKTTQILMASSALVLGVLNSCTTSTSAPSVANVELHPGSIKEVLSSPATGSRAVAFYLPVEGRSVAQVVIEKRPGRRTYFLKGLSKGSTVGGVVPAGTLDGNGFDVKDQVMMARVQAAINQKPTYINVR